jgi:hypothetical protein
MTVDFAGSGVSVFLNPRFLTWAYDVSMTGRIAGSTITGSGNAGDTAGSTPPLGFSCSNCTASFQGAFFGAGASHAGLAYQVNTGTAPITVSGVAVFKQ